MPRRKSNLNAAKDAPKSLVQGHIDSLTQGVSQQPSHLRQVGQGERQVNGWSSPVNGLTKRRPTQYVGKILSTPEEDFYLETMPVQAEERYSVFLRPFDDSGTTKLRILITLNGETCDINVHGTGMSTVNIPGIGGQEIICDNTSYLFNQADYLTKYVLINNGPLGLLLNREKVVEMDPTKTAAQATDSLIFIKGVNFSVTYQVTLDGTELTAFTTPAADDDPNVISTDAVAEAMRAAVDGEDGFTATREGSVVHVVKDDGGDYSISITDNRSNTLATVIKESVTFFSELPVVAPQDFLVKVEGSAETTNDDIWVKFVPRDAGTVFGEGTWQETTAPDVLTTLAIDTMPIVIRRDGLKRFFVGPADGTEQTLNVNGTDYTYEFPEWGKRTAGDEETVPSPSFVGQALKDHVLYRSRYVVIGGENVILSEVDDAFNFFNDTAVQVLETDPIDVRAASETSIPLVWILPIDESLLLFSEKSQFQLRAADADVLTPRTAIVLRLSNIDMNRHIRPKIAGPNVIFATEEYGFTGFREYQFFDTQQRRIGLNLGGNLNITLNVPKYIEGLVNLWDVGESLDYFVCRSPDNKKKLYVYKYLWQSSQGSLIKQQSSWSEWEFDGEVQWVRFFDNKLWVIFTYADGTFTTIIESEELTDTAEPAMYMDRQLKYPECNSTPQTSDDVAASYDASTGLTTFTLPYEVRGHTDIVVRTDEVTNKGVIIGSASSGNTIVCERKGDWTATKLMIGRRYKFEYEFNRAHKPMRDQARSRIIGDLAGRLQLSTWTVAHYESGDYTLVVKRKNRSIDSRHKFNPTAINVHSNLIQTETDLLDTGTTRIPVCSKNTECSISVESDSWTPLTLVSCWWEGNFNDRARSLS